MANEWAGGNVTIESLGRAESTAVDALAAAFPKALPGKTYEVIALERIADALESLVVLAERNDIRESTK